MSIHIPSMIGSPFTESSHTKQQIGNIVHSSLQAVDAGVVQDKVPMFEMEPTNVVPPSPQVGIPLSMRGTPTRGVVVAKPSNLMAGQRLPKPMSAVPPPGSPSIALGSIQQLSVPVPSSTKVSGTLKIKVPYDSKKKPMFDKIKEVLFVPR